MINYNNFYNYICELCQLYQETKSLKGMSEIAKKWGVKSITKEQFFQFKLDNPKESPELFDGKIPNRGYCDAIRKDLSDLDRLRYGGNAAKTQAESVFGDSLPWGLKIKELPAVKGSPYRYALCPDCSIDNADEFCYTYRSTTPFSNKELYDAVQNQIDKIYSANDGIADFYEFQMPAICCSEWIDRYEVAFIKVFNNGTCFWLSDDKDILRLHAWLSFVVS